MSDRLHIRNEMAQLDLKQRSFWSDLTDEEKKKFSNYLMIRWSSTVSGTRDLQEYYVQSCNNYLNRHFFAINRHPHLQWLCATAVSPGLGRQEHAWISPKKKEGKGNDVKKKLMDLYPNMKVKDIELWATMVDKRDITALEKDLGKS